MAKKYNLDKLCPAATEGVKKNPTREELAEAADLFRERGTAQDDGMLSRMLGLSEDFLGSTGSWMKSTVLEKKDFDIYNMKYRYTLLHIIDDETVCVSYGTKLTELLNVKDEIL